MTKDPEIKKQAEKIFIETDEEIIFAIEKIKNSEKDRILLIVPQHALLVSSIVNLKLLSRQVASEDKLVILVTQNELAKNKIQETNIISVEKPEQVDEDLWEKSRIMSSALKEERQLIKEKLLSARKEAPSTSSNQDLETVETKEEDTEQIEPIIKTHRLKAKEIEIGPFVVLAGGDISKTIPSSSSQEISQSKPEVSTSTKPSFTGVNLKNVKSDYKLKKAESYRKKTPSRFQNSKYNKTQKPKSFYTKKISKYAKYLLILIIPFVFLNLANRIFSKVTIDITPKTQPKNISDTITASADISVIDLENKIIPLKIITKTKSGSESAPTTGTSQKGDFASGTVYIYNKTDREITLEPGHKITSLNDTSLSFELTRQITIPERISEITRSEYEDAPIRAVDYGDKYNIGGHDVQIDGYATGDLSGRIYSKLRGGSSQEVRSVSQDDVSKLKEALQGNLKSVLQTEIRNSLEDDDILIEQTKKVEELAFDFFPSIDEESPTFDITKLEIEMSIYAVSQKDLDTIIDRYINSQSDQPVDIQTSKAANISNILVKENGTIEFDISKEVKTSALIDTTDLKNQLAGKNMKETEKIVSENESIATFEIKYKPFYIPVWIRKTPLNTSRIELTVDGQQL